MPLIHPFYFHVPTNSLPKEATPYPLVPHLLDTEAIYEASPDGFTASTSRNKSFLCGFSLHACNAWLSGLVNFIDCWCIIGL
ncbi:hypothetical protein IHE45_06G095900 [Dioscorea alata]|uniref:Uncharacterized protein n=1 Tax=Dioscorea alata TaxID=55571 RepID=A0ACB7VYR5_DIOAL|nr:hypothetical protein IHE45_06G095900 [Dioscorea alata]